MGRSCVHAPNPSIDAPTSVHHRPAADGTEGSIPAPRKVLAVWTSRRRSVLDAATARGMTSKGGARSHNTVIQCTAQRSRRTHQQRAWFANYKKCAILDFMGPRSGLKLRQRQRLGLSQEIKTSLQYLALAGIRLERALARELDVNPFLTVANTHSAQDASDWLATLATPGPETVTAALRDLASDLFWRPEDRALADLLIDEANEQGLLDLPLAAIAEDQRHDLSRLRVIQDTFLAEGGLLADDLGQSLAAQARTKVQEGAWLPEALPPVLDLCTRLDAVARGAHRPDADALAALRTLNPRPASCLNLEAALVLPPDLIVEADGAGWRVSLNPLTHRAYALDQDLLSGLTPKAQQQGELADLLKAARSTVRALSARQDTLLRLADFLCQHQDTALRKGRTHLVPLTQSQAAVTLGCGSSTLSRAVAGKTAQTPLGVWALQDFFTSLIDPATQLSAAQLRGWLIETLAGEDRSAPLSDAALCAALSAQGHRVARRTLTKHRLRLGVPGATDRRRLYRRAAL